LKPHLGPTEAAAAAVQGWVKRVTADVPSNVESKDEARLAAAFRYLRRFCSHAILTQFVPCFRHGPGMRHKQNPRVDVWGRPCPL